MGFCSTLSGCLVPKTHSTTPSVVIKDARLGILNLVFSLCICGYVGFYSFLYNKGWAAEAIISASGRGRFIMPPTTPNCTDKMGGKFGLGADGCFPIVTPAKELPYCSPSKDGYYNMTEYKKIEQLLYQEDVYVYVDPKQGRGHGRGQRTCIMFDNSDLTIQMGDTLLFLATWFDVSPNQQFGHFCPVCTCLKCDIHNQCVDPTDGTVSNGCEEGKDKSYGFLSSTLQQYVPQSPESLTLQLTHSYTAQNMNKKELSSNMVGFLAVSNDELCQSLEDANPDKDPYQPNTKYKGEVLNDDLNFLMNHDDNTKCLMNLNRTNECIIERNKALLSSVTSNQDNIIKLNAAWMISHPVCFEDHYLVSTLLLASWDKSNSYATPLLDSPNFAKNKTCDEEPSNGFNNGFCPEEKKSQDTGVTGDTSSVPMRDDIDTTQVFTSYTYEPTPLPYVFHLCLCSILLFYTLS